MLHERHDRAAEGRPLLAPLDDAAHARRRRRQPDGARHLRAGHDPAGRADVPRERVGLSVPRDDARREARLSRARTSIPRACSTPSCRSGVTWTAGVPTIWLGILAMLDAEPDRWDLSQMKGMLVGGSAAPRAMIAGFKQRHGLSVVHGWGMTETSPVASTAQLPGDARATPTRRRSSTTSRCRACRCRSSSCATATPRATILPWDGESMGELEMRGPWVAAVVLRHARAGGALDRRRLVQDRRRRRRSIRAASSRSRTARRT